MCSKCVFVIAYFDKQKRDEGNSKLFHCIKNRNTVRMWWSMWHLIQFFIDLRGIVIVLEIMNDRYIWIWEQVFPGSVILGGTNKGLF